MGKYKTIYFDYVKTYTQRYEKDGNKVVEELADLSGCFERVSKINSVDRTYNMGNEKIRIQELKKVGEYWEILVLKLRDEVMPGIADDSGNYSIEILEDGKYYCESTTMLYDPENSVLVLQKNRYGLQASNVEILLNLINVDNKIKIILKPIINKNKIKLLDNGHAYRSLEIGIVNNMEEEVIEDSTGIMGVLNNFQKYKGNVVSIRIGYNKKSKKNESLDSNLVIDTINELYGNIHVNKLKTSIKFNEDTKVETIDLLDDRIYDYETLTYCKENPITHDRIISVLRNLYKNKKSNMRL